MGGANLALWRACPRPRCSPPPAPMRRCAAARRSASPARRCRSISPRSATTSRPPSRRSRPNVSAERLTALGITRRHAPPPVSPTGAPSSPAMSSSAPAALSSRPARCRRCRRLPGLDNVEYLTVDAAFDLRQEAEPPHRRSAPVRAASSWPGLCPPRHRRHRHRRGAGASRRRSRTGGDRHRASPRRRHPRPRQRQDHRHRPPPRRHPRHVLDGERGAGRRLAPARRRLAARPTSTASASMPPASPTMPAASSSTGTSAPPTAASTPSATPSPARRWSSRAEYQADRVVRAILFRLPHREHSASVPSVTFTDPALASVGLTEADARRRYPDIRVLRFPFVENDLAQAERIAERHDQGGHHQSRPHPRRRRSPAVKPASRSRSGRSPSPAASRSTRHARLRAALSEPVPKSPGGSPRPSAATV